MGVPPIFYLWRGFVHLGGWRNMQLEQIIEQAVTGLGYELADFETSPRGRLLRVFIDTTEPERGITVEDCSTVSNHLSRLFEVENIDYDRLEVSSPGLDRALKKPADFERFTGREAQIRVRVPVNGQRNFSGVLAGLKEGKLHLQTEGVVHTFDLTQIEKARLAPRF